MGRKKVRVTNELVRRLEREGVPGLTRNECRALTRRGYLEKRYVRAADGSSRLQYKLASNLLKEE